MGTEAAELEIITGSRRERQASRDAQDEEGEAKHLHAVVLCLEARLLILQRAQWPCGLRLQVPRLGHHIFLHHISTHLALFFTSQDELTPR